MAGGEATGGAVVAAGGDGAVAGAGGGIGATGAGAGADAGACTVRVEAGVSDRSCSSQAAPVTSTAAVAATPMMTATRFALRPSAADAATTGTLSSVSR